MINLFDGSAGDLLLAHADRLVKKSLLRDAEPLVRALADAEVEHTDTAGSLDVVQAKLLLAQILRDTHRISEALGEYARLRLISRRLGDVRLAHTVEEGFTMTLLHGRCYFEAGEQLMWWSGQISRQNDPEFRMANAALWARYLRETGRPELAINLVERTLLPLCLDHEEPIDQSRRFGQYGSILLDCSDNRVKLAEKTLDKVGSLLKSDAPLIYLAQQRVGRCQFLLAVGDRKNAERELDEAERILAISGAWNAGYERVRRVLHEE